MDGVSGPNGRVNGGSDLTAFEHRILTLRTAGLSRVQIARQLGRSPQTISNSLTIAKEKLGASTLMEAARLLLTGR
jgi:DNA-binding CsgD family transcriptional regulator